MPIFILSTRYWPTSWNVALSAATTTLALRHLHRFASRHASNPLRPEACIQSAFGDRAAVARQPVVILLTSNTSDDGASVDDDSNDGANGTNNNGGDSNMLEQRSRR